MLNPSELGNKEYWDQRYELEISNYNETGDSGEVWFGERVEQRMIKWLIKHLKASDFDICNICEVGCGNGHLLICLAEKVAEMKLNCQISGGDYSKAALNLAGKLAGDTLNDNRINFFQMDLLSPDTLGNGLYDIVLDKGTFDAICLNGNHKGEKLPSQLYVDSIFKILKPSGILLITSCNWTEKELLNFFKEPHFRIVETLPSPTFSFGGVAGSTTCSIAFQKV